MDVIYANREREDIGYLGGYTMDLAFGSGENDFECVLDIGDHCCESGYYLYADGTEYGGIIDTIAVDTDAGEVTYKGRSWHGIMNGKVLCPDPGQDYLIVDGEANAVLKELLERAGLDNLFQVSEEDSGITIDSFQFQRYVYCYSGILKMLESANAKLWMEYSGEMVNVKAILRTDFSDSEEFDSGQIDFCIEKNYRPVNHLVCLGQGDLKNRAVIHLFTDENGGIQPYSNVAEPVQDSDYILDLRGQLLVRDKEVAEVYDYSGAAVTENYIQLVSEPEDWYQNIESYYEIENDEFKALEYEDVDIYTLQDMKPYDWSVNYGKSYQLSGSSYQSVSSVSDTVYSLLTSKPSTWSRKYSDYYTKSGSTYSAVKSISTDTYKIQKARPSDWKKNYGNYYYYYTDGVTPEYKTASGTTKYIYLTQTMRPSDWEDSYGSYYYKSQVYAYVYREITTTERLDGIFSQSVGIVTYNSQKEEKRTKEFERIFLYRFVKKYTYLKVEKTAAGDAPKWKKAKYYTRESYTVPPVWKASYYYTKKTTTSAPAWAENTYYKKGTNTIPTWTTNKYYTKVVETVVPEFVPGSFYKKVIDRYAELVAAGIKKLEESYNCDTIETTLDTEENYDVGDIVGAAEERTGLSVWQPITKKIVKIDNGDVTIEYEVGK